jgi:cation diffusion facilitator CzcD-associated flavoprotein CzcO
VLPIMGRVPTSCVVVGAGPAGLTTSAALAEAGVEHVVLERNDVADTWQNQRWDSFRLNTPGWMNSPLGKIEPTSFSYRDEVVELLADRATSLPVHANSPVVAVDHDGSEFVVRTPDEEVRATTVVLANGLQNVPKQPAQATQLASRLFQIHTRDYRSPAQLPDGAVLVVGSGQSGCQIAEDVALAGRRHQHHLVHRLHRRSVLGAIANPGCRRQAPPRRLCLAGSWSVVRGFPVAHPSAVRHPARLPGRCRRRDLSRCPTPRLITDHLLGRPARSAGGSRPTCP